MFSKYSSNKKKACGYGRMGMVYKIVLIQKLYGYSIPCYTNIKPYINLTRILGQSA